MDTTTLAEKTKANGADDGAKAPRKLTPQEALVQAHQATQATISTLRADLHALDALRQTKHDQLQQQLGVFEALGFALNQFQG